MNNKIIGIILIIVTVVAVGATGYFLWQNYKQQPPVTEGLVYQNNQYGFQITLPQTWKGYAAVKNNWQGQAIDGSGQTYSGPEILIKNPQTTATQQYQDIPIMVFTEDQWAQVGGENPTIAVSAAPIGPAKIGENANYVFATPPRWYGFTDAVGFQEAVGAVKTFKAF